ncbi:MAG: cation diffusion facilitator family transporter [Clostridium sp.]
MITFDGLYSLISLFLSIFAIMVTTFISKSDFKKYPFGKAALEPIIVVIKSIVLLGMCLITLSNAVKEALAGGNNVDAGFAMFYAIVSSVGCTIIYSYMRKSSKKLNSEIVKAESNQWLMDTILSVGVLVGFMISMFLTKMGLGELSKYVDPGMVIITSLIFLKVPITSLIEAFKEVIHVKADDEINEDIYSLVKEIEEEYNMEDSIARVAKMGRELRIEIDFVVSKDSKIKSLDDMDKVREIIDKETNHFELKKWLNVNFTKNRKWAM